VASTEVKSSLAGPHEGHVTQKNVIKI